jgi:hypothetical protein
MSWGVADQALSSLTNFALGLVVVRRVSAPEFGAFSLSLAAYLLALGASRGLNSEPFVVRFSDPSQGLRRQETSWATGAALMVGLAGGAVSCTAGLLLAGRTGAVFVALGVTLPGLLLQDAWRYCYVALGRSKDAFLNDLVWALLMIPLFELAVTSDRGSAAKLLFLWGLSGSAAGVLAAAGDRVWPRPQKALRWLSEQRDLSLRYLGEFAAANGSLQVTMYLVALLAGISAAGSLRAGFLLLGPVMVVFQGIRLVVVPEGVRLLHRSSAELRRMVRFLAGALAMPALAWGGAILLIPSRLGRAALGSSWPGARALVLPLTLMLALSGAQLAAVIALRSLAAARSSLKARVIEGCLTLSCGTAGAALGSALATAWALVGAYALEVVVWWWQFGVALRRRGVDTS